MVILALVNAYLPGYKAGGPIQSLANLAEKLGDGFQIKIITADRDFGDSRPYSEVAAGKWQQVGKAQVLYLAPGERWPWNLRRILNDTAYDVLYLNSLFHPGFAVLPLLLRRAGLIRRTPVVMAPRGELAAGALGLKNVRKRLFLAAVRALRVYNRVLWQASSRHEEQEIQQWFPAPAGTTNTLVASDLPFTGSFEGFELAGSAEGHEGARGPKRPGCLRLLFASRISPKKNLLAAIRCVEKIEGAVEFNILGPVEDQSYWLQCQNAAKSLPAGVNLRYWGPVPHERVLFEMGQHELFILPTLGENFGHAILESLSAGCPVLIGDQTPWRELDSKQAGWDLPVGNGEAFRAILERCVDMDEPEHRKWRAGARALAASVVFDDTAVRASRDLFIQAMQFGSRQPAPGIGRARQETTRFRIPESRSHFDAIAASWEKKYERGGAFQRRMASFLRCLRQFVPAAGHILDFGCGSGDIALASSEAGYEITGIDLSSAMIARARLRSYGRGIAFELLESDNPFALPYPDQYFDGVIASSVFEYVRSPVECLKELRRVSKPGAALIATVPNIRHPRRWMEVALRIAAIRGRISAIDRCRAYAEYLDVSTNRFPLDEWTRLLRQGGWEVESVQAKARSLAMLIGRAAGGAPSQIHLSAKAAEPGDFEHVFGPEA